MSLETHLEKPRRCIEKKYKHLPTGEHNNIIVLESSTTRKLEKIILLNLMSLFNLIAILAVF